MITILLTGTQEPLFGDAFTWFVIFLSLSMIVVGTIYNRSMHKHFNDENKKLTDKLSERSHNVMMQKWDLERRNLSISQQNRDIMESLHYAQNIQNAILPKPEKFGQWFSDSFIYYKPKDIVSGDFYFLEKYNSTYFIATADCTGHGVAGAFMSMLGNSILKQIIQENGISNPAEILSELNRRVLETLRHSETSSHGGMDIALCTIDDAKRKLRFSGANRPLIIIRNYELLYHRGDKTPIGGFFPEEDRTFTCQEFDIQLGDRIYMYTDGYADQFGGMEGKKLMTKKFKEIVFNVHESPMKSQQQTLDNYLENWKGRFEQVDDVLVLGFKID